MTQPDESGLQGSIIGRRVVDTSHVHIACINVDHAQFTLAIAKREEKEMIELQSKYEKVVEAYNSKVWRRMELENKILGRTSRPRITYPHPLVEPFKSTPL